MHADNALFITEFTAVFVKMLTKGYDICALEVVPAAGSGAGVEALYGITAIKEACGVPVLAPEAVDPTTSGPFPCQCWPLFELLVGHGDSVHGRGSSVSSYPRYGDIGTCMISLLSC